MFFKYLNYYIYWLECFFLLEDYFKLILVKRLVVVYLFCVRELVVFWDGVVSVCWLVSELVLKFYFIMGLFRFYFYCCVGWFFWEIVF